MSAGVRRPVGRCYACRLPVYRPDAVRVEDRTVRNASNRLVRRLAHAGRCEQELRWRIGAWRSG